jgi:hypothetical protein
MVRYAGLMLGALIVAASPAVSLAQSMAKMDGPVVTLDNLKSQTFGYWKQEKKPAKPAVYEFMLPETLKSTKEQSAILTITPVSDEQTGFDDLKKIMVPPDGKSLDSVVQTKKKLKTGAGQVTELYFFGTIQEGGKKKTRQRVVAVVLPTKEKKYLISLIGPSLAVGVNQQNFEKWVQNFK